MFIDVHLTNTAEQNEVKPQALQMWKTAWRGKESQGPAEVLKHTVSKDFRKIWGLRVLRDTENLIKYAFSYLCRDFDLAH